MVVIESIDDAMGLVLRFLGVVPVGSRVRVRSELVTANHVGDTAVNLTVRHPIEIDGQYKPAAIADHITRFVF